jgi:hypothetical protein
MILTQDSEMSKRATPHRSFIMPPTKCLSTVLFVSCPVEAVTKVQPEK